MVTNIEEKIPFNCIRSKSHRFNSCVVCQGNERPARLNEILWWNNAECTNQLPALKIIVVRIIHRCRVHTPSLRRTRMCKVHGQKGIRLSAGEEAGQFLDGVSYVLRGGVLWAAIPCNICKAITRKRKQGVGNTTRHGKGIAVHRTKLVVFRIGWGLLSFKATTPPCRMPAATSNLLLAFCLLMS